MVQAGVLLSVLCVGVAAGALLAVVPAGGSEARVLSRVVRGAPIWAVPPGDRSSGAEEVGPERREIRGTDLPAAVYAPVEGALDGNGWAAVDSAAGRGRDSVGDGGLLPGPPPARPGTGEPDAGAAARSLAAEGGSSQRDNVATLSRNAAAGAMLFAVSTGDETILFDVGVPGARALPENISGRWAWVGSCLPVVVEISQLPGTNRGDVRGVGSSGNGSGYGWVVPASGCRGVRSGVGDPAEGIRAVEGSPTGVVGLKSVGSAPCDLENGCRWFVGLDSRGRVVALLARSFRDTWIRLGGAFDDER